MKPTRPAFEERGKKSAAAARLLETAPATPVATIDAERLVRLAKRNPWRMFTGKEIALICDISEDTLNKMRACADSPFSAGKARPETVVKWLRKHPGWSPSKS